MLFFAVSILLAILSIISSMVVRMLQILKIREINGFIFDENKTSSEFLSVMFYATFPSKIKVFQSTKEGSLKHIRIANNATKVYWWSIIAMVALIITLIVLQQVLE